MENGAQKVNGRYQLTLPLRVSNNSMSNSKLVTERRLNCLRPRLVRDTKFYGVKVKVR